MPSSMRPGDVLAGRYRLVVLLSENSGGRFWRAWDEVLGRHVALHLIAEDDERAEGLLAAARDSARLQDPHLLRVLDANVLDGACYVVNEWGEGHSLDRLLQDGPLTPRRAAWIVCEVAHLVASAHEAGIAHGRLVPENVLVDESGSVKVIGFAVDAALHGLPPGRASTDVTDLAAVLYAALTGRWPGISKSTLPPAPEEHGRPLRPRQVRAGVPRALDNLCDEVLSPVAPTRDHGYGTARAIADAMAAFVGDTSAVAEAEAARSRDNTSPRIPRVEEPATEVAPSPHVPVDETQAGVPVFYDHLEEVGWASPSEQSAPPPPPFEEPAERPLFAPEPAGGWPVRTAPASPTTRREDSDEFWPWDGGGGTAAGPAVEYDDGPEPGRRPLRIAALLVAALLIAVAMLYAFERGHDSADPDSSSGDGDSTAGAALEIAAIHDFDPLAEPPSENPDVAGRAADGDPATYWHTETYLQDLGPGGLKEGVGLLVDLGSEQEVADVTVTLVGSPTAVTLYAAPGGSAPTSLSGLDELADGTASGTTLDLQPESSVTTRYLVVWLTSLPAVHGGFRGEVAEVEVR